MIQFILLLGVYVCSVCCSEKVYYYGAPIKTAETAFIKLDPSTNAWEPAASGFGSLDEYVYSSAVISPDGTSSMLFGQFTIWNGSYVGCLLRIDTPTMSPSVFNSGVVGSMIANVIYYNDGANIAIIGDFLVFQQNPTVSVNNVAACTTDGLNCYALGNGLPDYSDGGILKNVGDILYAYYGSKDSILFVAMFNTTQNQDWQVIYEYDGFYDSRQMALEMYQGNVWLLGAVLTPNNTIAEAAMWNVNESSWEYFNTIPVIFDYSSGVQTAVSPNGQHLYMLSRGRNRNITILLWMSNHWKIIANYYCANAILTATNDGPVFTCNSSVISLAYGGALPNLTCSRQWQTLSVGPDNSTLYTFCSVEKNSLDTTVYDLNIQQQKVVSELSTFQVLVVQMYSLCIYGQKIAVTGYFDSMGGVYSPGFAIWDGSYQKWYQVLDSSVGVTYCYCDTDGSDMATVCLTGASPMIILDDSSSDSGTGDRIDHIQVYNVTLLQGTQLTQVILDGSSVYFGTITPDYSSVELFLWAKNNAQSVFKVYGTSTFFEISDEVVLLTGGGLSLDGTNTTTALRYDLKKSTWLPVDALYDLIGGHYYDGISTCMAVWPYTGGIYVAGDFTNIGSLKVMNWGGYNSSGQGSDSVGGGVQDQIQHMAPTGSKMYMVTTKTDCSSILQNGCGRLFYYDTESGLYSNAITQGVTAVAVGKMSLRKRGSQIGDDSSSPDSNHKKTDWVLILVICGVGMGLLILLVGSVLVYRKMKPKSLDYREIPDMHAAEAYVTLIDFQHDDFVMKSVLGRGAYGTVWSCVFPQTAGGTYAVKQMLFSKGESEKIDIVKKEIDILEKFRHPHIVHYCGHRMETTPSSVEFFIFMELYENSLKGVFQKRLKQAGKTGNNTWFSYQQIKSFLIQIAEGLHYLHLNGVAHRDLKCGNILVRMKDNEVASLHIADFGISRVINLEDNVNILASTVLGTPSFMAPEVLGKQKYDVFKADMWSFGIMMFEMMAWAEPQVPGRKPQFPEEITKFMNENIQFQEVVEIFDKCTQQEPNSRPTASDLLSLCELLS